MLKPPARKLLPRPRLLWLVLLFLIALLIFLEFIAEIGGTAQPLPSPPLIASPVATASSDLPSIEPQAPPPEAQPAP